MTTGDHQTLIRAYARDYLDSLSHLKPKTLAGYESLLRSQIDPVWGTRELGSGTRMQVRQWDKKLIESDLSASRIRQAHHLLGMIIDSAAEDGLITTSWVPKLKLNRSSLAPEREGYFLSEVELVALAGAMPSQYAALPIVIGWSGLRWGEACALRRSRCHVTNTDSFLDVAESVTMVSAKLHWGTPKSHKPRSAMLPQFAADVLQTHLAEFVDSDPHALVFTSPAGSVMRAENFRRRVWRPAVAAAGLPADLRPHDLRDTCASLLMKHGADIKIVQEQMGHSSGQITIDRYVHVSQEQRVALMRRVHDNVTAVELKLAG